MSWQVVTSRRAPTEAELRERNRKAEKNRQEARRMLSTIEYPLTKSEEVERRRAAYRRRTALENQRLLREMMDEPSLEERQRMQMQKVYDERAAKREARRIAEEEEEIPLYVRQVMERERLPFEEDMELFMRSINASRVPVPDEPFDLDPEPFDPDPEPEQEQEIIRRLEEDIEREPKPKPKPKGRVPVEAIEALKRKRAERAEELYRRTGAKPKPKPEPASKKGKEPMPSSSTTEFVREYLDMRDIAETATIPLEELDRITIMDEIDRIDEGFEADPDRSFDEMKKLALILSKIPTGTSEVKIKSKIGEEFKKRLKDIEDPEILDDVIKTVEQEYLEEKISREDRDALMSVIKDRKKVLPVKVKIKNKILTPELAAKIYKTSSRPKDGSRYTTTNSQTIRKYLYL
ncbi:MAG TPA: hypothetical protein V6C58_21000 [Allocoleopsis sp.]